MTLPYQNARVLSIEKWERMIGDPLDDAGRKRENCGFCMRYWNHSYKTIGGACGICPLKDRGLACCMEFNKWGHHRDKKNLRWARYWAQKILDRIKALPEEEMIE